MLKRTLLLIVFALYVSLPAIAEIARDPVAPTHQHAEVFRGRVVIETSAAGDIVVGVDVVAGRRAAGDGMAEHLFVLQRDEMLAITEDYPRAQIVVRDGSLEVRPPAPAAGYLFALSDVERSVVPGTERIEGFGLSHMRGRFPLASSLRDATPLSRVTAQFEQEYKDGGSGAPTCQAGGTNALSCSLSCESGSCSVTCASGSYACCRCTGHTAYCSCVSS
jgi:hypothetical protein